MLESRPPVGADHEAVRWRLPHTLTLLPTYRCTAACRQCCFQSNPHIKLRVPQAELLDYIDQAAGLGTIRLVCISGGEAFVLGNDLVQLVARAAGHRMLTRVVSNGSFAAGMKSARARLAPLVEAGLNEINFSTGDDHVEFVPVQRVINGIAASLEYGLGIAVMVESGLARRVTAQTVREAARSRPEVLSALEKGMIPLIESPWMQFAPGDDPIAQPGLKLANRANVATREPCTSVMSTVVVTPTQKLGMCCGLPRESIPDLQAGSLLERSMRELIDESSYDFIKIWIFVEGPERILAWAAEKDPTIEWENRYAHNCDACRAMYLDPKVMRVIEDHYEEKFDEVMFKYALYHEGRRPAVAADA